MRQKSIRRWNFIHLWNELVWWKCFSFITSKLNIWPFTKIWQCKRIQLLLIIDKLIIINAIFKKKKVISNKYWTKFDSKYTFLLPVYLHNLFTCETKHHLLIRNFFGTPHSFPIHLTVCKNLSPENCYEHVNFSQNNLSWLLLIPN